jgi:hypothetical protein
MDRLGQGVWLVAILHAVCRRGLRLTDIWWAREDSSRNFGTPTDEPERRQVISSLNQFLDPDAAFHPLDVSLCGKRLGTRGISSLKDKFPGSSNLDGTAGIGEVAVVLTEAPIQIFCAANVKPARPLAADDVGGVHHIV